MPFTRRPGFEYGWPISTDIASRSSSRVRCRFAIAIQENVFAATEAFCRETIRERARLNVSVRVFGRHPIACRMSSSQCWAQSSSIRKVTQRNLGRQ